MKKQHCILTLLLIFLFSCKTIVTTPQKFEGDQISFGNGGGFTGAVSTYVFLENGQYFSNDSLKGDLWYEQTSLNKKVVRDLLRQSDDLKLKGLDHDHPGNMYKFIKIKRGIEEYYVCWGASDYPIKESIPNFYFQLMEIIEKK